MSRLPEDEFQGALKVLHGYYQRLMKETAEDIIKHAEDFDGPFANPDNLVDEYYNRLYRVMCPYATLRTYAVKEKPKSDQPLEKNEFRCFGCGGVIRQEDESCRLCGWTWK
jgi:hypothetical protein